MPNLIRYRLAFLFGAISVGMYGVTRNDSRAIYTGIVLGLVGLVLRFLKPKPPQGEGAPPAAS